MYKKITMLNPKNEEVEVEFLANAATPLRYKSVFKKDLLTQFANAKIDEPNGATSLNIDFLPELAFIMAMQARALDDKEVKLDKLNENLLMDWLEGFDSFSFENKAEEILDVYYGNSETTSESKKNNEEQTEK